VLPDNHFAPFDIKTRRDGTITFEVKVPGPGRIDALETAWNDNLAQAAVLLQPATGRFVYGRAHTSTSGAGTIRLQVRPSRLGSRLVHHHRYQVTLRLWISYTPANGLQRTIGFHGLHLAQR
jgi:hypothetical protein